MDEQSIPITDITLSESDDIAFPKTDVLFLVEGKETHVCSKILKQVSPVFRAMFESDFKEKSLDRIELPGKSYKAMVEFLKCTYPFISAPITDITTCYISVRLNGNFFTMQFSTKVSRDFLINLFRGRKEVFVQRTDIYEDIKEEIFTEFGTCISVIENSDAESTDWFKSPGFDKGGFPVGNTIPTKTVIAYVLAAEQYKLSRLLIVSTQYMAMRMFSHYESTPEFLEISANTRFNIAMLRHRMIEYNAVNGSSQEKQRTLITRNY